MAKEFIKWQKKFSVGLADIDEQHKHFIKILNDVHAKREKKNDDLKDELNELVEYARIHFTTEEGYFDNWKYPYSDEHKQIHAKLISDVLKFKRRFDEGENIMEELTDFLKEWLEVHLKIYDGKYAKYFKENHFIK